MATDRGVRTVLSVAAVRAGMQLAERGNGEVKHGTLCEDSWGRESCGDWRTGKLAAESEMKETQEDSPKIHVSRSKL